MKLENLVIDKDDADTIQKMRHWIGMLPEGTIQGLSEHNVRNVRAYKRGHDVAVGSEVYNADGNLRPIMVNVPSNCAEIKSKEKYVSFKFRGWWYRIHFR